MIETHNRVDYSTVMWETVFESDAKSRPSERQNESFGDHKNTCIRAVFAGHQHLLKSSLSRRNQDILVAGPKNQIG
ncbi:hypothetical protein OUZ56_011493 [Daphnia magna]|uniref:Uncharacterized protein n=1 Tax=Daphnia magna TaxID=35525 RepID=A0ABQ9Z0J6_9CRUS|nr:hypothetical protein OUZ56_011493 [Daphnia magna]